MLQIKHHCHKTFELHFISCVGTGFLAVILSLWRRDRNHMDSYWLSMVNVLHVGSSCTEVVLNGIRAFPVCFNTSCHRAIWQRCIATCFTQFQKTLLYTTTSCHLNFDPGTLLSFVNMVLGRSHYPYESQRSTHCSRLIELPLAALKGPLDGQYFCTIFEVAQWYWTFVGTIERLCNVMDGIKTFWNMLRNLKILCRLWVVLRNIPSILLFRFSFFCLSIDYEFKMWRKSICYWIYRTV